MITAGTYSAAIDTPTNRKWVQAMRAEYKDDPGYCTIGGYLGVLFIEAGRVVGLAAHRDLLRTEPAYGRIVRAYEAGSAA